MGWKASSPTPGDLLQSARLPLLEVPRLLKDHGYKTVQTWEPGGGGVAFSYSHPFKPCSCPVSSLAFPLFTQAELVFIHTFVLPLYVYCFFSSPHPPAMLTLFAIMNFSSLFKCQINILSPPPPKKRGEYSRECAILGDAGFDHLSRVLELRL